MVFDHVWIAPGVKIGGNCIIGESSFLGMNATISQMSKIGNKNFIGANTLISGSTEENSVYINKNTSKFRLEVEDFLKISSMV